MWPINGDYSADYFQTRSKRGMTQQQQLVQMARCLDTWWHHKQMWVSSLHILDYNCHSTRKCARVKKLFKGTWQNHETHLRINTFENIHRIQSRHTLVIDEVAQSDPMGGGCHRSGKGCHHYGPARLFRAGEIWSKNTLESFCGLPHLFRERLGAKTALQVWEVMRFLSCKNRTFPYKRKRSKLWKTEREQKAFHSFILGSFCKSKTLWDIAFSPELIGEM